MIQINYPYTAIPFELVANNEPAASTGDPTAILYRNGSASGVTVTVVATAVVGLYHCSFTTGSDWDKTDRLYLQASATVGGISDRKIIWDSFAEPDAVMRGTDYAATEANQDTAKTAIDAILVDTDATIPGLIATAGSDATLAKQDEILAAVAAVEGSDATLAKQEEILAAVGAIDASVNILPAVGIVADRSPGATISPVVGETISQSITLYQTDGVTPFSLAGKTLAIPFETMQGVDVAVVANADITISGDDGNVVTFAYPAAVTASERTLRFAIKDEAAPLTEYLKGLCNVTSGPRVDP